MTQRCIHLAQWNPIFSKKKWQRTKKKYIQGWNDKIVALEKTRWFHLRLMKTGCLFFCCRPSTSWPIVNKSQERYHVWKWHNVQRARSEMRRYTTHALYRSKLWQQEHYQHPQNANPDGSTCPGWWKQSVWLRLSSLVWFQVRATSCHLTSSKSARKSTPKCTWMCWRVWWSPGAVRWPVAVPGCGSRTRRQPISPKGPRLGFRRSATTLYPSLTAPPPPRPEPDGLLRLVIRRENHQHDLP